MLRIFSKEENVWWLEVGVIEDVLDLVVVVFIVEIIVKYGYIVFRLCNKDFLIFRNFIYLVRLFFKFKFIFMVWDVCVVFNLIIDRKIRIRGVYSFRYYENYNFEDLLRVWNVVVGEMNC